MEAAIDAQGIPEAKWFMAKDAEQQDFADGFISAVRK
jgi:hypothetical protein